MVVISLGSMNVLTETVVQACVCHLSNRVAVRERDRLGLGLSLVMAPLPCCQATALTMDRQPAF